MTRYPPLPLTPDQLPRQRPVEVVELPPVPAEFDATVCLFWMPEDILPKTRPRKMAFLGTVEWAWAPGYQSNVIGAKYRWIGSRR